MASKVTTTKDDEGIVRTTDGLYWFQPITRQPWTRTIVRYHVVRLSDRLVVARGRTITAASEALAAHLAKGDPKALVSVLAG